MNYPLRLSMKVSFLSFGCCEDQNTKIDIDTSKWEFKMVSQGNNSPDFQATDDSIEYIPVVMKEMNLSEGFAICRYRHQRNNSQKIDLIGSSRKGW